MAKYYDKTNPMTENAQFKLYIKDELETRINELPDQGYDEADQQGYKKKIAQITFAYENSLIINQLAKRGTYLKEEKWNKVKEVEDKIITDLTAEDSPLLDLQQKPVSVFVSFETEEGVARALTYNDPINP